MFSIFQRFFIFLPNPLLLNLFTYAILIFLQFIYPVFTLSFSSQPSPVHLLSIFLVTSWYICLRILLFFLLLLFWCLIPLSSPWSLFYFSLLLSLSFIFCFYQFMYFVSYFSSFLILLVFVFWPLIFFFSFKRDDVFFLSSCQHFSVRPGLILPLEPRDFRSCLPYALGPFPHILFEAAFWPADGFYF